MADHRNVTSSGYITSTTQIVIGKNDLGNNSAAPSGYFHSVQLLPDGTNACSVVIYNSNAATAGQEVAVLSIAASTVAPMSFTMSSHPICCEKGIRAVLSGTGGKVIVGFSLGS